MKAVHEGRSLHRNQDQVYDRWKKTDLPLMFELSGSPVGGWGGEECGGLGTLTGGSAGGAMFHSSIVTRTSTKYGGVLQGLEEV